MAKLSGQVAVVQGAARGIGAAIGKGLAAMGATIALAARDETRLKKVATEIESAGGQAEIEAFTLLSETAIEEFAAGIRKRHGHCDILVNNAGVGRMGKPLWETALADWYAVMETNLHEVCLMIRAFAPHDDGGEERAYYQHLVPGWAQSVDEWSGVLGFQVGGANGLTYSVAEELRDYGVRVSVVAPGSVNTGFGGGGGGKDLSRKIQPEDVANVVAMLVTQAQRSFVSEVLLQPTFKT